MKHLIVAMLIVALSVSAYSATFESAFGRCAIRKVVESEMQRSGASFDDYAIDWTTDAIAGLEMSSSGGGANDVLQSGVREFVSQVTTRRAGKITINDLEAFRNTAKACGMYPCSGNCCSNCATPPCGKKNAPSIDLKLPDHARTGGLSDIGAMMDEGKAGMQWRSERVSDIDTSREYRSRHCDQSVFTFQKLSAREFMKR